MGEILFFIAATIIAILFFRSKRWFAGTISVAIALVWVAFYQPVTKLLAGIGVDSFAEANNFDLQEALFYLETIRDNVEPKLHYGKVIEYLVVAVLLFLALRYVRKRFNYDKNSFARLKVSAAAVLILASVFVLCGKTVSAYLRNSDAYNKVVKNFNNAPPALAINQAAPSIVVYIGESTSVMDMGIYGYIRNTTPNLQHILEQDDGALLFRNVFSTHTHTTPSLLEALSLDAGFSPYLPIEERKRVSLVDILNQNGLPTYLVSNQGQAGTWNQASSIVFRKAQKLFSTENKRLGNRDTNIEKPFDHVFFARHLPSTLDKIGTDGHLAVFLHSYAGHGGYHKYIPQDFRKPIDPSLAATSLEGIFGKTVHTISKIEEYDAAIRYVDYSVSEQIREVQSRKEPIVFIYFSDHGDAVYANRGHDSSRFIHEMARVPFLMYFNAAATRELPDLYAKYSKLAESGSVATLAQVAPTIIDILARGNTSGLKLAQPVMGADLANHAAPIIVRERDNRITYVNLNSPAALADAPVTTATDTTDEATAIFAVTHSNPHKNTKICYHRSNTIGKALRGSLVADCLETDLVVQPDNTLAVVHPPLKSAGITLGHIIEIANRRNSGLWIDAKNLDNAKNCNTLANYLDNTRIENGNILVEFPSRTAANDQAWAACAQHLRASGLRTSHYVPTKPLISCSKSVASGQQIPAIPACLAVQADLAAAHASKAFSDFSFDYEGILAMEKLAVAGNFNWNTWNVPATAFSGIHPEKFRFVILKNKDPNNR